MSAIIYQFPVKARPAVGAYRDEAKRQAQTVAQRMAKAVYSSAWYHDEAINEDVPGRKN